MPSHCARMLSPILKSGVSSNCNFRASWIFAKDLISGDVQNLRCKKHHHAVKSRWTVGAASAD